MKSYLSLLSHVLDNGTFRDDRTGTGTWSVFGEQVRFRMDDGFPLLTTKKLHLRSIIHELLWFLRETLTYNIYRKTRFRSGMNGQMRKEILGGFMVRNGRTGRNRMVGA